MSSHASRPRLVTAVERCLIGSGLSALVEAKRWLESDSEGELIVLNPLRDFFEEETDFPALDFTGAFSDAELALGQAQNARRVLSSAYPGTIEIWQPETGETPRYQDPGAPFVRSQTRTLLALADDLAATNALTEIGARCAAVGYKPQLQSGLTVLSRVPGAQAQSLVKGLESDFGGELLGLVVPRCADFDVERYRSGLLEFLRERTDRVTLLSDVQNLEWVPGLHSVRFFDGEVRRQVKVVRPPCVHLSPSVWRRLESFLKSFGPDAPGDARAGLGSRFLGERGWEVYRLTSKEPINPQFSAAFVGPAWRERGLEGAFLRPAIEGLPQSGKSRENLLELWRPGSLGTMGESRRDEVMDESAMTALHFLCDTFLGWRAFTVRACRPRRAFELSPGVPRAWSSNGLDVVAVAGVFAPLLFSGTAGEVA